MKKIIFSDYDGTLFTKEDDMKHNVEMIHNFRLKGNQFVIATGRSYVDFEKKIEQYNIPFDYLILNHGAVVLDHDKNMIQVFTMDSVIVREILDYTSNNKKICETILFDPMNKDVSISTPNIVKIMFIMDSFEEANIVSDFINTNFKESVKSYVLPSKDHSLIEVISSKTDKSEAIRIVLNREKISDYNVFTIGDGPNDIEMIQEYNGYGMEKSKEIVYENTKKLYPTVSSFIEDILKKNIFKFLNEKDGYIRLCQESDVDDIYATQNKVIDHFKEDEKGYFLPFKKESYLRIINNPNSDGEIYGAFLNDKMIAWIFLSVSDRMKEIKSYIPDIEGECADIDGVIVLPEYRGNTLQKILVEFLEEKAKEKGISNLVAEVTFGNYYSLRNLQELGYEIKTWYDKDEKIKRYILLKKI